MASTLSRPIFWSLDAGDAPALILPDGNVLSYAALARRADELAAALPAGRSGRSFGFLLIGPELEPIARYLGCLRSRRHVPLLLNGGMPMHALERLLAHFRPDWVAGPPPGWHPDGYLVDGGVLVATGGGTPPHPDLALLLATSGSTGAPKLARLSHAALAANASSIVDYLGLSSADRAITSLPLAYSFGMSILNSHLAAGGSLALTSVSMLAGGFWDIARERCVTSLSGVPSGFDIMRRARLETRGLGRLHTLTQAGGRLGPALAAHFDALCRAQGWRFFVMYGQTEAAPRMSYVPPDRLHGKIGSVGVAVPGGSFAIDPATDELIYRGPNVMMGYAGSRDDLARGDDQQGVLRTGDLAEFDADGYAFITGRLSRFVKLAGGRVSLDAVEAALAERSGGAVAATGRDDELRLWLTPHVAAVDADIKLMLHEMFGIFAGHVRINRIAELPLQASGKLDYAGLTALGDRPFG